MFSSPEEEVAEEIIEGLARELKKLIYSRKYFNNVRSLDAPAEKLVYLYIWICQPQTFTSIKRCLRLPGTTVARSLRGLKKENLITQNEGGLYWLVV